MKMLVKELSLKFISLSNEALNYKWLFYLTLVMFSIYVLRNYISVKKAVVIQNKATKEFDNTILFNELEKRLVSLIIEKSNNQQYFTVNELNTQLGVKNKSIEIQKKVRTEAIIRINHKFNVNFNMDTVFIERVRSIEDRRYFNYYINDVNRKIFTNNL